ncbi:MAG: hypothetical protein JWM86_223 [Thermoleophilia bacterium]|nr:hypothetical protein [Thermoleophilia bacterium]
MRLATTMPASAATQPTGATNTGTAPEAATQALLVKLSARPDFSEVERMPRGAARKSAAYAAVVATAAASQATAISLAEQLRADGAI